RGVVRIACAEDDLELRIVLGGMGTDRFVETGVAPVHRLEDRNPRPGAALPDGSGAAAPSQRRNDRKQVVSRRHQCRSGEPTHSETSATPQMTSDAPAQRSQFTCSFRIYFASTVSNTYVTAVAGTAKLSSEKVSSAI